MSIKNSILQISNFHLVIITILFLGLTILSTLPHAVNIYAIKTDNPNFIDLTGASGKLLVNSLKAVPEGSFVKFNFSIDGTKHIWLPLGNLGESFIALYPNQSDVAILLIDSISGESQSENFKPIADPDNESVIFKVVSNNVASDKKLTNLDAIRLSAKNTFRSLNKINFIPRFTLQTALFSNESNELALHHKIYKDSEYGIFFVLCLVGFAISLIKLMYNLLIK